MHTHRTLHTHVHGHSNAHTQTLTPSFDHPPIICTCIFTDSTYTHSIITLLLRCLSYILMPGHLTPLHVYLDHSSIPARCKYGTETDPVYSTLSYFLMFLFYLVILSITLLLITALLGLELSRKTFHCTCACDIKT